MKDKLKELARKMWKALLCPIGIHSYPAKPHGYLVHTCKYCGKWSAVKDTVQ